MHRPVSKKLIIVVLIFACIGALNSLGVGFDALTNYKEYTKTSNTNSHHAKGKPNNRLVSVSRDYQCPDTYTQPQCEKWQAAKNLEVQWEMSYWAKSMLFMSIISLIITIIGVTYVALTLVQTRHAVESANKGVMAANDANKIARESLEKQLRAYINITKVSLNELVEKDWRVNDYNFKEVNVFVNNTGQTPAYDVLAYINIDVTLSGDIVQRYNGETIFRYIPNNTKIPVLIKLSPHKKNILIAGASKEHVKIDISLDYTDEFLTNDFKGNNLRNRGFNVVFESGFPCENLTNITDIYIKEA